MASCIKNILTKNYQNLIIGFQIIVKNVGDVFLGHSVQCTRPEDALSYFSVTNLSVSFTVCE